MVVYKSATSSLLWLSELNPTEVNSFSVSKIAQTEHENALGICRNNNIQKGDLEPR